MAVIGQYYITNFDGKCGLAPDGPGPAAEQAPADGGIDAIPTMLTDDM